MLIFFFADGVGLDCFARFGGFRDDPRISVKMPTDTGEDPALRQYVTIIPTLQEVPVQRHFFGNPVIGRDLQVRRERKPQAPRFQASRTTASI